MKYVLDSSVGFKWLVTEPLSDKAELLRQDYQNGTNELLSPDVFPVEVIHALTRAERQGRITPMEGAKLYIDLMTCLPRLLPYIPFLPRAYEMSSQMRVGVYDCLYVAVAEQEKCDLITADDKMIKNLQGQFPFIKHLSTLP
jgi:predicted nucleic acid-binding protein